MFWLFCVLLLLVVSTDSFLVPQTRASVRSYRRTRDHAPPVVLQDQSTTTTTSTITTAEKQQPFPNNINAELIAILTVYFVQGALGLSRLATTFFYKDELHMSPAEMVIVPTHACCPLTPLVPNPRSQSHSQISPLPQSHLLPNSLWTTLPSDDGVACFFWMLLTSHTASPLTLIVTRHHSHRHIPRKSPSHSHSILSSGCFWWYHHFTMDY